MLFAKYFFEVYDSLSEGASKADVETAPRYLQLLALLAFHTFVMEGVQVAIFETHNGGEYDATNVIQAPAVTAITALGMDHIKQLGPSLENIAWHKAGIFKLGSPAFSTFQDSVAATVLQNRAIEKGVTLRFVNLDRALPYNATKLKLEVQRINCSLARAIADAFLERRHSNLTTHDIRRGIELFSWPGRFELITDAAGHWFLDGAHNELSIQIAAQWFTTEISSQKNRYLVWSNSLHGYFN